MLYDVEQIRDHYRRFLAEKPPDYYERFDPYILDKRPLVRRLLDETFRSFFPQRAEKLLDLGCGTCFYYPLLSRYADTVLGIDVCVPMLEQAEELIRIKNLRNCSVQESSALDLPLEDQSIDVVLSWDFLHHCPDVAKSIDEIARVLRSGGRYVAVEPNLINPSIFWYHLRRREEWGLLSKNQFRIPHLLRRRFRVRVGYDNTVISYLNENTWWLWKRFDALTSVPPLHVFSFRYVMECFR